VQTHVSFEAKGDIGILTLACEVAGKPATLDHQALDELADRLEEIRSKGNGLRAAVVQSDSEKYFVVGANVNVLATLDVETIVPWIEKGHAVFNELEALPLPVVARVEGYALGGGLELAMACDLIVASDRARLGQPEANLGFVAGWGGCYRLPRRVGLSRAKELFFTGQIIDAARAYEIGLVDFVGEDSGAVDAYLASFFDSLRKCSKVAVSEMKRLVNISPGLTLHESNLEEAAASRTCLSSGDTRARVAAFLERRKQS
jgi:enoyl-CoA hydratase